MLQKGLCRRFSPINKQASIYLYSPKRHSWAGSMVFHRWHQRHHGGSLRQDSAGGWTYRTLSWHRPKLPQGGARCQYKLRGLWTDTQEPGGHHVVSIMWSSTECNALWAVLTVSSPCAAPWRRAWDAWRVKVYWKVSWQFLTVLAFREDNDTYCKRAGKVHGQACM